MESSSSGGSSPSVLIFTGRRLKKRGRIAAGREGQSMKVDEGRVEEVRCGEATARNHYTLKQFTRRGVDINHVTLEDQLSN